MTKKEKALLEKTLEDLKTAKAQLATANSLITTTAKPSNKWVDYGTIVWKGDAEKGFKLFLGGTAKDQNNVLLPTVPHAVTCSRKVNPKTGAKTHNCGARILVMTQFGAKSAAKWDQCPVCRKADFTAKYQAENQAKVALLSAEDLEVIAEVNAAAAKQAALKAEVQP